MQLKLEAQSSKHNNKYRKQLKTVNGKLTLLEEPKGKYIYIPGDSHSIILGDTRAGKTRRALLATIHVLSRGINESLIIFDPKKELFPLTSPELAEAGYEIIVIDLEKPELSSKFNPLTPAIEAAKAQNHIEASKRVGEIANALVPEGANVGQAMYFYTGAVNYIKAVALACIYDENCPEDQKSLATVSRLLERFCSEEPINSDKPMAGGYVPFEEYVEQAFPADHVVTDAFGLLRTTPEKERKALISTAQTMLALFRDPAIADMTSVTDNPIANAAEKKQAIYLVIPSSQDVYKPFATMFLDQMFLELEANAKKGYVNQNGVKISGRNKRRVNIICEELCSINAWSNLENAVNIGAGYGIRLFLIIQNLAIFESKYREAAKGILSNCANKLFIKTGDADITGKYISGFMGDATLLSDTTQYTGHLINFFSQKTVSKSTIKRPRINPDELLSWNADCGSLTISPVTAYVYNIPFPDVSCTPTNKYFHLGSIEHNLQKTFNVTHDPNPPWVHPIPNKSKTKWLPGFKNCQNKEYSSDEYKNTLTSVKANLAQLKKNRRFKQNKSVVSSESKQTAIIFNTVTGKYDTYRNLGEYTKALLERNTSDWIYQVFETQAEQTQWVREQKSKIKNNKTSEKNLVNSKTLYG